MCTYQLADTNISDTNFTTKQKQSTNLRVCNVYS